MTYHRELLQHLFKQPVLMYIESSILGLCALRHFAPAIRYPLEHFQSCIYTIKLYNLNRFQF